MCATELEGIIIMSGIRTKKKKKKHFPKAHGVFLAFVCDAVLVLTLPVTGSSHPSVVSLPR